MCHTNLLLNTLQITEVRLPQDSNGRPKGFGYAEFEDKESLLAALTLNNEVNVLLCIITSAMLKMPGIKVVFEIS